LLPLSTDPTWSPPRGPSGQLLVRWFWNSAPLCTVRE
jgi:hypothetical protein